jgi:hypothetical protein
MTTDGTYVSADLVIWSVVESGMYLIAACLPTLRPLVLKFFNKARETTGFSKGSKGSKGSQGSHDRNAADVPLEWRKQRLDDRSSDEESIFRP